MGQVKPPDRQTGRQGGTDSLSIDLSFYLTSANVCLALVAAVVPVFFLLTLLFCIITTCYTEPRGVEEEEVKIGLVVYVLRF